MPNITETAYKEALKVLRLNVTKRGFLAAKGGYDSIWARDGAITILAAVKTGDEKLLEASLAHLRTMKSKQTDRGLIPNHINTKTNRVHYGGNIGRISAVDANLWYTIAGHEYYRAVKDKSFMAEFGDSIAKALDYAGYLDTNNDNLLEVPESSDWADMFPRSGNVLAVDVLHYRALKLAGDKRADAVRHAIRANYLLGSAEGREAVNKRFHNLISEHLFNEMPYLVSHLTAFGLSWRLDVFGNILASLWGILTKTEAAVVHDYMRAVGIADPYPVRVLYPEVHPGDPEWSDYMVRHMLNLPHQYHNGGIWPFIGGFYGEFLKYIGVNNMAQENLQKLAELNRQGIKYDWEFNEWMHGVTGRPMGKKFQAWSAAGYVLAYHALKR